MANVGSGDTGKTLIGNGNGKSPIYEEIGTNSGLTASSVVLAQGNNAFNVASPAAAGTILMSNGPFVDPSFQGGGSFVGNTITGDQGGPLAPTLGNWDILGQQANTNPVMDTLGSGSTLRIEDRTYPTEYVVDPSSTNGLRGTFTTVQSAMVAAAADGRAGYGTRFATILIRPGTYTETFTAPAGSFNLMAWMETGFPNTNQQVTITGTITLPNNCDITMHGIAGSNGGSAFIAASHTNNKIACYNCNIGIVTYTLASLYGSFCTFGTLNAGQSSITVIASSDGGNLNLTGTADFQIKDSTVGTVTLANDAALICRNCSLSSSMTGSSTVEVNLINCNVSGNQILNPTATLTVSGMDRDSQPITTNFFGSNPTVQLGETFMGNIQAARRTAISTTISRYERYVGASGHGAAITFTLPNTATSAKACKNCTWTFADEDGNAQTNPITIATNGGTINGAASIAINTNYGAVDVIFDGTNYFASPLYVAGPSTSTDNALVRFDGTTGRVIQNGVITEDDTGNLSQSASVSGASLSVLTSNTSNTASATAFHQCQVAGSTASDAYYEANINGGQAWTWGLDNSDSDAYVLSASATPGTTNVMRASTAGEINYPLQPAFLAYVNTTITDVTGDGTEYTIIYDTEVYDQNGDFNLASSTFTAPVTGKYLISAITHLIAGTILSTTLERIVTSNRTYRFTMPTNAAVTNAASVTGTILADMDVGDTFTVTVQATDTGGKIDDVAGLAGGQLRTFLSAQLSV